MFSDQLFPMPSDKRNSITAKAMGLISSLFNVASSWDVPFCQPLHLQCSRHGSTKAYLCSPFLSRLPSRWQFAVAPLCGFMEDSVTAVIVEVFNMLSFCLKCSVKFRQHWKRSIIVFLPFRCDWSIRGLALSRVNFPYFHIVARKDYTLCNGASISKYKAYWHMNLSLINRYGTSENNIHGHSFFWSGTCEFTNIIIVTKK